MKRGFGILSLLCLLALTLATSAASAREVTAFEPGERLVYVLKLAGIPAGDSVMEVMKGELGGVPLYKVVSTATSRTFVDLLYKVRDHYETYINPMDGLTRKYVFNMREGGKSANRVLLFDQEDLKVTRISEKKGNYQTSVFDIPPRTQDSLSAFYALRNETLKVGDSLTYRVFDNRKNWELVIDVIAAETIKVKAGEFRTVVVHPKLKFEGIFRRKGDLHVYLTDDQWHIPVLMKSRVKVGTVAAELVSFTLGGAKKEIPSMILPEEDE